MSNPTATMRAYVGTPAEPALRTVREPRPMPGQALVRVEAFSVNSDGELGLFACRSQGWRPGRHIAGHVLANAGGAEVTALTGTHRSVDLAALGADRVATTLDDADVAGKAVLAVDGGG
jgi:hypothetical protein